MTRVADFDDVAPETKRFLIFDFDGRMPVDASLIGSPTVSAAVVSGDDPSPQSRILTLPAIVNGGEDGDRPLAGLGFLFGTAIPGTVYRLQGICQDDAGENLSLWNHIDCVAPG